jgi:hypothetical protein
MTSRGDPAGRPYNPPGCPYNRLAPAFSSSSRYNLPLQEVALHE